jgi:hypothetical protein
MSLLFSVYVALVALSIMKISLAWYFAPAMMCSRLMSWLPMNGAKSFRTSIQAEDHTRDATINLLPDYHASIANVFCPYPFRCPTQC